MHRLLLLLLIPALSSGAWRAGVAERSITPREPVWMSGYGNRSGPAEGVAMPLRAKALALEDETGRRFVIVTTDLIGFSRLAAERIAAGADSQFQLSRDSLLLTSSHTHTGPAIEGNLPLMQPPTAELRERTARYTRYLEEQAVAAIGAAIEDLEPAVLRYHIGEATFSQNRRQQRDGAIRLGDNPDGPTDHTVPVLRVAAAGGRLKAALFSYVSHNTTLTGSHVEHHGDYAGAAQAAFEKEHPGALGLFALGCAGDQNPAERGTIELAEKHGRELASAVEQAMGGDGITVSGALRSRFERFPIELEAPPDDDEWRRRASELDGPEQQLARYYLARGATPSSYSYPLQTVAIGDELTLVALGGEVTVEYALNIKKRFGAGSTWVLAYSNDVMSYIPTAKILAEGGYEAERSQTWYGMPSKWRPSIEATILERVESAVDAIRP